MEASRKLLVIEDDCAIQELLSTSLKKGGWQITIATSGEAALLAVSALQPDLILLDYKLPGVNGLQVCRSVRNYPNTRSIPIIMLSAVVTDAAIVSALEVGADDVIRKPFSLDILRARMQAVLRRGASKSAPSWEKPPIKIHNIQIDPVRFTVRVDESLIKLTRADFEVLMLLAAAPGRAFSRRQIIEAEHGEGSTITDRSVDVQMVGLRRKIGQAGKCIETVRGVGYRMKEEESSSQSVAVNEGNRLD